MVNRARLAAILHSKGHRYGGGLTPVGGGLSAVGGDLPVGAGVFGDLWRSGKGLVSRIYHNHGEHLRNFAKSAGNQLVHELQTKYLKM